MIVKKIDSQVESDYRGWGGAELKSRTETPFTYRVKH